MKFKSIVVAAALAIALAFQPAVASATGVGTDGYVRTMWIGTDGSISAWKLDSNFNYVLSHNYGPYAGWTPVALTVLGTSTYVLWRDTDGTASIWELDANLNFVTASTFGPVAGWVPTGLGVFFNNLRLFWWTPANQWTTWAINASLIVQTTSPVYGPYFGWLF